MNKRIVINAQCPRKEIVPKSIEFFRRSGKSCILFVISMIRSSA